MKPFAVFLSIFAFSGILLAQDLEERDEVSLNENSKNINKIEIREPLYQIKVKGCADFTPAAFEGGAEAYKTLLKKYMYNYLNSDLYRLNGDFSFLLSIDENGRVTDVEGSPKVANSSIFFDDMKYVVRRIKPNWNPAKCDGKPVTSQIKIKMNFSSATADL